MLHTIIILLLLLPHPLSPPFVLSEACPSRHHLESKLASVGTNEIAEGYAACQAEEARMSMTGAEHLAAQSSIAQTLAAETCRGDTFETPGETPLRRGLTGV